MPTPTDDLRTEIDAIFFKHSDPPTDDGEPYFAIHHITDEFLALIDREKKKALEEQDLMHPKVQEYAKMMVQSAYEIYAVNHPRSSPEHEDQKRIINTMFP